MGHLYCAKNFIQRNWRRSNSFCYFSSRSFRLLGVNPGGRKALMSSKMTNLLLNCRSNNDTADIVSPVTSSTEVGLGSSSRTLVWTIGVVVVVGSVGGGETDLEVGESSSCSWGLGRLPPKKWTEDRVVLGSSSGCGRMIFYQVIRTLGRNRLVAAVVDLESRARYRTRKMVVTGAAVQYRR